MTVSTRYRVSIWNDEQWEPTGPWFDTFEEAETAMHETIDRRSPYARVVEERTEVSYTIKARATSRACRADRRHHALCPTPTRMTTFLTTRDSACSVTGV